jgi:predicted outer membrane protein
MKRQITAGFALLLVTALSASGAGLHRAPLNQALEDWNKAVAINGLSHFNQLEIADANNSLGKIENPEVTEFARKLVTEHTAAQEKVEELAEAEEVILSAFSPATFENASSEALENIDVGLDYDKGFLVMMIQNHKRAQHNLEMMAMVVQDAEVKAALARVMATVQAHLAEATELLTKLMETPTPNPTGSPSPSPTTEPSPSPTATASPSPSPTTEPTDTPFPIRG